MEKCAICKMNPVQIKKRHLCKKCYAKYRNINESYLCCVCGKNPVAIKKSELCNKCYHQKRRISLNQKKYPIPNLHENEFIGNYFRGKNYIYTPAIFRLSNGTRYIPDFYDPERRLFIEVAGTRQAFHANKEKYNLFTKDYPDISFQVMDIHGNLYISYITQKK